MEGERQWPAWRGSSDRQPSDPARTYGCGQDDEGQRRSEVEGDHHRLEEAPQAEGQRAQPEEADERWAAFDTPTAAGRPPRPRASVRVRPRPWSGTAWARGRSTVWRDRGTGVGLVEEDRRGLVPLRGQWGTEKHHRRERAVEARAESLRRLGVRTKARGNIRMTSGWVRRWPPPTAIRDSDHRPRNDGQQCVEREGQRQHVLGVTPDGDDLEDDDGLHEAEDDPTAAAVTPAPRPWRRGPPDRTIPAADGRSEHQPGRGLTDEDGCDATHPVRGAAHHGHRRQEDGDPGERHQLGVAPVDAADVAPTHPVGGPERGPDVSGDHPDHEHDGRPGSTTANRPWTRSRR